MKRGAEYTRIISRNEKREYELFTIVDGGRLFPDKPRGTHVVKNPKYNGEPEFLFFGPNEFEPVYPKKNAAWHDEQKRRQELSGSESQER